MQIIIDFNPHPDDVQTVRDGIVGFNQKILGETATPYSVFLKNEVGAIVGGVLAWLHSEAVYIDVLWLQEDLRKQGLGSALLLAAENEALQKGCRFSIVDTFSFQAEGFYLKNGYAVMGEIKDYLFEHSRIFLKKNL